MAPYYPLPDQGQIMHNDVSLSKFTNIRDDQNQGIYALVSPPKTISVALIIRGLIGRSGGAERIYCELANILHDAGFKVTCLFYDNKNGDIFYPIDHGIERINLHPRYKKKYNFNKVIKKIVPSKFRDKISWCEENSFFIEQLKYFFEGARPDIAISLLPPANTPTLIAAQGTSVKVIPSNHNVPAQDYDNPERWSANPIDRKLRLEALDDAAAIHVLFPQFGEWFPDHLQDRIVSIPNYISPSFSPSPSPVARDKIILAVGRLAGVKNYLQLIRSWASIAPRHPDWKMRIFGTGPQLQEMKSAIGDLGLKGRVELAGHSTELTREYQRASIFCHPALFEGFGLSPAEALFMGTPVVCYSDCSGVNQFVKDGYNGLTINRDSPDDELAKALEKLMIDTELREKLGRNGPDSVSEFSLKRYKESWARLITRLAGEK